MTEQTTEQTTGQTTGQTEKRLRILNGDNQYFVRKQIERDEEYKSSLEELYRLTGTSIEGDPQIDLCKSRIEINMNELDKYEPPKIDEGITDCGLASNSSVKVSKYPVVFYQFIENPKFTEKPIGNVPEIIESYLRENGYEFSCERDTHIGTKSFSKFNFVKEMEGGPSLVTILCSEYSKEIYVFTDSFLNYPINKNDIENYGGECIEIKKNNTLINIKDLTKKLDGVVKEEIKKAKELFQKRFGDINSDELLSFALLHSVCRGERKIYEDLIKNFRPLIDGDLEISIPRFYLPDGSNYTFSLLYGSEDLPFEFGETQPEIDKKLVEASRFFHKLNSQSEKEFNGEKYVIKFDKIHIYQLGLYSFCLASDTIFEDNEDGGRVFDLYEEYSYEFIDNFNANGATETNHKLLMNLINKAFDMGRTEILDFAEKNKVGFHSQNNRDLDALVHYVIGFIGTYLDNEKLGKEALNVFDFLINKCGNDIYKRLSENSNGKNKQFFIESISKWRELYVKYYLNEEEKNNNTIQNQLIKIENDIFTSLRQSYLKSLTKLSIDFNN